MQQDTITHVNHLKSIDNKANSSNFFLKLMCCLSPFCSYNKATFQLLSVTTFFVMLVSVIFCFLFFTTGISLNIYPFIILFISGSVSQYFLQKQLPIIAAILALAGFLLCNTMLILSTKQAFNTSYLFLLIPFITAVFLYPKKQLCVFFIVTSIALYLFTYAVTLFSSLLFSNSINEILLFKSAMALTLCAFVFVVSNFVAQYLKENEINIQSLKSEIAMRKLEIKNFSGMAAHDLREPLHSLSGYSALLKESLSKNNNLTDKQNNFFEFMDDSAMRMLSLLDDLSIFSVSEVDQDTKTSVDLNVVLKAVKNNLHFTIADASAVIRIDDLPIVTANFNPMLKLFQNIVSNGIKYQPKSTDQHKPTINIRAERADGNHIIYISDNGIGIPESRVKCIFEPLIRLHSKADYSGTGLGLSICKLILNKYDGKIKVHSVDGVGTTFAVYLPIEE